MPTTTSPPPKDAPSALDVSGDFRNLRTHGTASLGELKEFLGKLRRKSPQEVIGIVSSSLLIQSVFIATAITIVFMAVFTVGPYFIWGSSKAKPAPTPTAPAPTATAAKATPAAKPYRPSRTVDQTSDKRVESSTAERAGPRSSPTPITTNASTPTARARSRTTSGPSGK